MKTTPTKNQKRIRRHSRVRAKISGTSERPRLAVWKSNMYLYAQIIDDSSQTTVCAVTSREVEGKTPKEKAKQIGAEIAKRAQEKKIQAVVFDRGGFSYTGNIKEIADGAREGGLQF